MMNVALLRVLFTHAMLVRPRLALGPLAALGPLLADPRSRTVRMFLDLGRSFPSEYPVAAPVEEAIRDEHALARLLDYGLIAPRLSALYARRYKMVDNYRTRDPKVAANQGAGDVQLPQARVIKDDRD